MNKLVSEQKRNKSKRRKQSILSLLPIGVKKQVLKYDLVDMILVVALVPLLSLGTRLAY